jgi:hypothetical protein
MIICRGACELARARDVTPSNVEPIAFHPPLRNIGHRYGRSFVQATLVIDSGRVASEAVGLQVSGALPRPDSDDIRLK